MADEIVKHRRHVGDLTTLLSVKFVKENEEGVPEAINLTGKTVKFRLVDSKSGIDHIAETTTGVTITVVEDGDVDYQFPEAKVSTQGNFYGYFVAYDGTSPDTFPAIAKQLNIEFFGDI